MGKTLTEKMKDCDDAFNKWWTENILKVKKSTQHFPMKQFRMAWNFAWMAGYDQVKIDMGQ